MAKNDSGEIGIMVDTTEGQILVAFNQQVDHLKFTPEQAIEFAKVILEKVIKMAPETKIILPTKLNS